MQSQYKSNVWLTLRQCNKLKGKILKGSKGVKVRYVDFAENKETEETYGYMKWYTVFNLQQTTLYKEEVQEDLPYLPEVERNKMFDKLARNLKDYGVWIILKIFLEISVFSFNTRESPFMADS